MAKTITFATTAKSSTFMLTDNYVLVEPDSHFSEHLGLKIADGFDPAKHYSVQGTVKEVPNRLVYGGDFLRKYRNTRNTMPLPLQSLFQKIHLDSLDWDTAMEVAVGDRVHFRYNVHMMCKEENLIVDDNYLIRYDFLYMVNQEKMLNGWVLIEPIKWTDVELHNNRGIKRVVKSKDKIGMGVVKCLGTSNKSYMHYDVKEVDLAEGDIVYFRHSNAIPLEYNYHKTFEFGNCYRMQRKDILFVK